MLPYFSIILPTYSRPDQLARCLRAVGRLDYPRDRLEVIVVDDGGPDPLEAVLAPFRAEFRLALLRQENAGPAAARNTGAAEAVGDFLAFTDDDCLPESQWLRGLAAALADDATAMVGGLTLNGAPNLCSITSQLIVDVVYRHYNADPRHARFIASNNMALSRRDFREMGGFDPSFRTAEDRELCDRWLHRGNRIVYAPAARVLHVRPMGPLAFLRQHFQYGRGARRFNRRRAQRASGSMLMESRFHANPANWLYYPLTRIPARQVVPVATLLFLWQAANFAGFVWETIRGDDQRSRDGALSYSG